jgi:hypothetical protein
MPQAIAQEVGWNPSPDEVRIILGDALTWEARGKEGRLGWFIAEALIERRPLSAEDLNAFRQTPQKAETVAKRIKGTLGLIRIGEQAETFIEGAPTPELRKAMVSVGLEVLNVSLEQIVERSLEIDADLVTQAQETVVRLSST